MKSLRKALPVFLVILLILAIWIWWNRPQRVNMAAYVPADSLIYLEANNLPEIATSIVSTDAWKALAPAAGLRLNLGNLSWLSHLASWTGIGAAESVLLSRAQVAITVLGMDAADAGDTLRIKPRYALVVETHMGEGRARSAVENRVGEFARRAYGTPSVEQKEVGGATYMTWVAPEGNRRIVAAVMGSVAFIGNDDAAVEACLAVRRNERPSLEGNPQVEEMRRRVRGQDALAFGYVQPEGMARLLEIAATAYAGQLSSDPRAQSAAASILPPIAKKILGGGGWSAHFSDGVIKDRYFLGLQNGVAERLLDTLAAQENPPIGAFGLLPREVYSVSRYNYRDPVRAWRGVNSAIVSQADTLGSILITRLLDGTLKPYGIEQPDSFLGAIGSEIVTARLDDSGASTVTIVQVRDETTLRNFVARRLGVRPQRETIGDAVLQISNNEAHDASSFVDGYLIIGRDQNVRQCLEARTSKETLALSDVFVRTTRHAPTTSANVVTLTDDHAPARVFMTRMAAQKGISEGPMRDNELEVALGRLRFAMSETQFVKGGFERRSRSSFGQFGALASQFAPANNDEAVARSK